MNLLYKSVFCLSILLIYSTTSISQVGPGIRLQKAIGGSGYDEAYSMFCTSSGKLIVAGVTSSFNGDITCPYAAGSFWIFQLDSAFQIDWSECFGGSFPDEAKSIKGCPDGGFIIIGSTNSIDGDVVGNHGSMTNITEDIWVLKLDSLRNIQWQRCLGGSSIDFGYDIDLTSDGGYILVGRVFSMDGDIVGNIGDNIWICKLDSAGTIQWSKCVGGYSWDYPESCAQTFDGGFYVAGTTGSLDSIVPDNHSSESDAYVIKLDSAGNVLWKKCYGGTDIDNAEKIIPTWDGGFYLACQASSQDGDIGPHPGLVSMWLLRCDSLGTILWQKSYGQVDERVYTAMQTSDGGIAMAGFSKSNSGIIPVNHGINDMAIIKVDSMGNAEWGNAFGGSNSEKAYAICQMPDQSFVIAGETSSNDQDVTNFHGGVDAWVVKLDPVINSIEETKGSLMNIKIFQYDNNLQVNFFSKKKMKSLLKLYDLTGREIYRNDFSISEGFNSSIINISSLHTGLFFIRIESEEGSLSGKVLIN